MVEQPRSCECFSLCGEYNLAWFHMHLPIVSSVASPWYRYLQKVYHEDVIPLPVNMRNVELLWANLLPTAMYLCRRVHEHDPVPVLPRCHHSQCSGWLTADGLLNVSVNPERLPGVEAFVAGHSFIFTPRGRAASRKGFSSADISATSARSAANPWSQFAVVQAGGRRQVHSNHTWIEVVRVDRYAKEFRPRYGRSKCSPWEGHCQTYVGEHMVQLGHLPECERAEPRCCDEGTGYGCWFWTARGSGVFVNTQRTLHVRGQLAAKAGIFGLRTTVPRKHWSSSSATFPRTQGPPFALQGLHDAGTDCAFANATRRRDADSLQVLKGNANVFQSHTRAPFELVVATDSCMRQTKRIRTCPPIPLRTGWKANIPCHCRESEQLVVQCGDNRS